MGARNYRDLVVWQKAMDLADEVYVVTEQWPKRHLFGLTGQAERAALSVLSTIAEGQGRNSHVAFKHFLDIANGSRSELEAQLLFDHRRRRIDDSALQRLLDRSEEAGRPTSGLLRAKSVSSHED